MIDISGVNLVDFVKKVYELSVPQGLGFIHARSGGLSDEDAQEIVAANADSKIPVRMDYVHGRACKMTVFNNDGKLEIRDSWYDHSDQQLDKLLESFGVSRAENASN